MIDINTGKSRDELMTELETAQASHDWTKAAELEAAIKELDEKAKVHKTEMKEAQTAEGEKKSMKMEELMNLLQDKPENAEKNAETLVGEAKTRLRQTIDRYSEKLKALRSANDIEKAKITKDLEDIKTELQQEKDRYETAKDFFMGKLDYKPEELSRISTRWIRFGKKTRKGGVVSRTMTERLQFSTLKRRMTVNTLTKKFNDIGNDSIKGVRFIMGFVKARFLRYTSMKLENGMDIIGGKVGLQMNPNQFHKQFNLGRDNIFAVLDKWEKTKEEQDVIDAIKKRINYYGYAYARQRASAWTDPFINTERWASQEEKIIQFNRPLASMVA